MPYNVAACDSSGYSYSGGQLDHLTYFVSIDVERQDAEQAVLDKVFALWFEEAAAIYGWSIDATPSPKHAWDWCARPQMDPSKTASARQIRLSCGDVAPSELAAEDGVDYDDRVAWLAKDYGVTEDEIRLKLFEANFQKSGGAPTPPAESGGDEPADKGESVAAGAAPSGNGWSRTGVTL